MADPAGLLKIGKPEHIGRLRDLGELYMRPLWKFAEEENDPHRGDRYEGTSYIWQPDVAQLQVEVAGTFQAIPGISGPIRHVSGLDRNTNVFCMYALRSLETPTRIDERNAHFGQAFAYITHVDEFLRRVRNNLPRGTHARADFVEYIDSTIYTGPMMAFRKRREFAHQSEFRIAVSPGTGRDLIIPVGDLSDILIVGYSEQIVGRRVRAVGG